MGTFDHVSHQCPSTSIARNDAGPMSTAQRIGCLVFHGFIRPRPMEYQYC
jgi:hypothetical protein